MAANHTVGHIESLDKLRARINAQQNPLTLSDLQNHEFNKDKEFEHQIPVDHSKSPVPQIAEFHAASKKYDQVHGTMSEPAKEHFDVLDGQLKAANADVATAEVLSGVHKESVASLKAEHEKDWTGLKKDHEDLVAKRTADIEELQKQQKVLAAAKPVDSAKLLENNQLLTKAQNEHTEALAKEKGLLGKARQEADEKLTKARAKVGDTPSALTQAEEAAAKHEAELVKLRDARAAKVQAKHDFLSGKEVKYQVEGTEIVDGKAKLVTKTGKVDPHVATAYNDMHAKFGKIADPAKFHAPKADASVTAAAAKEGEKAGLLSKAKTNGFFKTAGENMNLLGKDAEGSRRLVMKTGRIVGVGTGLYIASKGVGQLFSGKEEDSKLMAIGKIVVGTGGAALAAVAGR